MRENIRMQTKSDTSDKAGKTGKKWKTAMAELLRRHGFVDQRFTGKISLNFSCGAISDLEKFERHR